ncbi:MAG: DUF3943 domain-containing protein [Bacteroidales bacterium]|nr:DUF3943 domain-containing protein [Bacteroidales bacterium]MDD2570083.1 DUF3943 domain-containing protein [Bacteroidales bacterium]MDD2812956.1 DUF3943 domain-containing protein [Bacteroidales bacterium]MDD3384846.1 DUF3943 domain-containing protein [Bacteroidales bacterium]MDD3812553.1 DUF3943 domain-containing protein [Bacteroidales bacterium]
MTAVKRKLLLAFVAVWSLSLSAQNPPDTAGIWFRNCQSFGKRFLYSQTVLWPSAFAGHAYVLITEGHTIKEVFNWNQYVPTFTMPPVWDDDHWSWNYEAHAYMGSLSYLAYRNRDAHWLEAAAGTALNSLIYEYVIAGGTQRPSYQDMILTPTLGSLLGEGLYQLKKRVFLRDKRLNTLEKILVTITDPFEVFYFGFDYNKLARHHSR